MSFCDSDNFQVDDMGVMRHKRSGNTWVDRLMDGVDIDITMFLENCGYAYIEEDPGDEIVGDRKVSDEIHETSKSWGKERGEGKFRREKKIPSKKSKKYPTKPKPKHSWHKRLSKISIELGDVNAQTEQTANQEWGDFWDEKRIEIEKKEQAEKEKREQIEKEYWDSWAQEIEENPGHYAVISVKILVDPDGVSVHDIDTAGVNRGNLPDPYNSESIRSIVMSEWDKLPSTGAKPREWWELKSPGAAATYVREGFSFQQYNFFTYWDEVNQCYVWKSMNSHNWLCGGWRAHFDHYPDIEKIGDIFSLDKQWLPWKEVSLLSKWINGVDWKIVWERMYEIRMRKSSNRVFDSEYIIGDGWENRSRMGSKDWQIPRILFHILF